MNLTEPNMRLLSLGAGVQSTVLALLAAEGRFAERLDGAIFADTGWEPRAVYDQLDRIETEALRPAGIPLHRVSVGNIRDDALDPTHRFASMPLYILNRDGGEGMARRQCTSEYKLRPVREQTRWLLGAEAKDNGRPGRVPTGAWAETWIGFSTDEADRALRDDSPGYTRSRYPLLDLGWSRKDCRRYLESRGWEGTVKSSCLGCPYRTNRSWRRLRDTDPEGFADAVDFDSAIRNGSARATANGDELLGTAYLHRSRVPLDQAPIDRVTATEWASRQGNLLDLVLNDLGESDEDEETVGCSPFACSSGEDITETEEDNL